MTDKASGAYIINRDYDIISYNRIAKSLYPQLVAGEKCYKCLMGLDEPCQPCPVANNVQGPRTYFDPIRHIYETVDAVPFDEDGEKKYALVFSTTGERERYARQLPNTEKEFISLYEQEYYDKLTGGFSYKGIIREIEKILDDSSDDEEFLIMYFNIRNFKAINDIFGIEGGDTLLAQSYSTIMNAPYPPLAVGRTAGDRFIALVKKNNLHVDFLVDNTINKWTFRGKSAQIHSLCGIYEIVDKSLPIVGMIDRAKLALYSIDDEFTKPYAVFDENMRRDYMERAQVLADYNEAIKNKEFQVYYQPIIDVATGKNASAEALIRWIHPERGVVAPNVFVPVLEKSGYIATLDLYVMQQVFESYCRRKEAGKRTVPVSVNLSWMDLYDETLTAYLRTLLQGDEVDSEFIHLEATETALNTMEKLCGEFLHFLREHGAKVFLDDFGSGYSSFGMVQKYDFDVLKIDREFIRGIRGNNKSQNIIRAIITMCHEMDVKVVAEGVEVREEYDFLKANGCDYIQGYFFAKPMPEKAFNEFLDSFNCDQCLESNL